MLWTILCPGPSLLDALRREWDPEHAVAINRAVLTEAMHRVRHWCFLDPIALNLILLDPSHDQKALLRLTWWGLDCWTGKDFTSHSGAKPFKVWREAQKDGYPPHHLRTGTWVDGIIYRWTLQFAIAVCIARGAKDIDILGADLSPDLGAEFDGLPIRSPEAQRMERRDLAATVGMVHRHGVRVRRILSPRRDPSGSMTSGV